MRPRCPAPCGGEHRAHVLVDQHRIAVGIHHDEVSRTRTVLRFQRERHPLLLQLALQLTHVRETRDQLRIAVPTRVEGQGVLLEHPLEQADERGPVLEDQPPLGLVAAHLGEAEGFVERPRGRDILDGKADGEGAERGGLFGHSADSLQSVEMAGLPNLANPDYVSRINRAVDYITRNLSDPLPLDEVAKAACFSPYHFHRIFHGLMGETLASFVKRVRLERAVYLLSHRAGTSLTEIALACGFSSSSDFSRSFRAQYGVPPSAFDAEAFRRPRREAMLESASASIHRLESLPAPENPDGFAVRLRELPARQVAYIRVTSPYEGGVPHAISRLVAWAEERGLADGQWLGYQWDDPEIVPIEKCRYDVGLEVPRGTQGDLEAGIT